MTEAQVKERIRIQPSSKIPIYKQIIASITGDIEANILTRGDLLPSINEICNTYHLAKGTVITAYNELRQRGIVTAMHGKGFYIERTDTQEALRIFMIFDQINPFKQIIFDAFISELGIPSHAVSLFFHHYNASLCKQLITDNLGVFNYYVIMPHFNEDIRSTICLLPKDRTLLLDNEIKSLYDVYPTLCQAFESDMYNCLETALKLLKKYKHIYYIRGKRNFQFIPPDNEVGFERFCNTYQIAYTIVDDLDINLVTKNTAFMIYHDNDLIDLIKACRKMAFKLGYDVGVLTYDDTPMKEVLEGGITTISTDFKLLGIKAAQMIKNRTRGRHENPTHLIIRNSL